MKPSNVIFTMVLAATRIVAQGDLGPPQQQDSAAVALAYGQTARLSVLRPSAPAPGALTACQVSLTISDDQGNVLSSQDFTITGGGKVVSISVDADPLVPVGSRNVSIHGSTTTPLLAEVPGIFCLFVPGLDIIDKATGKAVLHLETKVTFPPNAGSTPASARTP